MHRYCFTLQVRPELMDEYVQQHRTVWPDMLAALAESGWHNYSLFLREDGLVVGYVESADLAVAQAAMARTEVNAAWQSAMADYFAGDDSRRPDEQAHGLRHIFHLEDQLAASSLTRSKGSPRP